MLFSELLGTPRLGLQLLHEAPGGLEEPVGRAITTDLLEPGRYLTGGELVLTGLVWRRTPEDSATFVGSCRDRGVTAMLAGTALLGEVPADLVTACRDRGVTLASVPPEVAFADITEHLAAAQSAESGARMAASLVRQRQLLSAVADGRSLDELAARVADDLGHQLRVLTPSGRHVVPGPDPLDDTTLDALTQRFLTADQLPAVVDTPGGPWTVWPVGSVLGSRLTSWFVVADSDHTTWSREHADAVRDLATIAALDRSRRDEGLRVLRTHATDALDLVRSGAPHAEVAARLRQAGLSPEGPLVAVSARLSDESVEHATVVLEDLALTFGPPVVAAGSHGLVALLPGTPDLAGSLRRAVGRLSPGSGRASLSLGLSGETRLDAVAGAIEEAEFAERLARGAPGTASLVSSEEVTSHVLLLATVPDDVRRTYAHRVLGPVVEHDRRSHSDLVATLAQWLDCSGSWTRTAEALHLHVNTVRYRIGRVQELTGRDLSRLEDRVDVFLALESL